MESITNSGCFNQLPDELLLNILKKCDLPSLQSVGATCSRFFKIFKDRTIWDEILCKTFNKKVDRGPYLEFMKLARDVMKKINEKALRELDIPIFKNTSSPTIERIKDCIHFLEHGSPSGIQTLFTPKQQRNYTVFQKAKWISCLITSEFLPSALVFGSSICLSKESDFAFWLGEKMICMFAGWQVGNLILALGEPDLNNRKVGFFLAKYIFIQTFFSLFYMPEWSVDEKITELELIIVLGIVDQASLIGCIYCVHLKNKVKKAKDFINQATQNAVTFIAKKFF